MIHRFFFYLFSPVKRAWQGWWRKQSPSKQDRFAMMGPLVAVLLFLTAIVAALSYLKFEEIDSQHESLRRDVEYAQQRLRLKLMDKQEQLARLSRDITDGRVTLKNFPNEARTFLAQSPEVSSLSWVDADRYVKATDASPSANAALIQIVGARLMQTPFRETFDVSIEQKQSGYTQPFEPILNVQSPVHEIQFLTPIIRHGKFEGVLVVDYLLDDLLRFVLNDDISRKYAVSLRNMEGQVLAGQTTKANLKVHELLPWLKGENDYEVPVTPAGYSLLLHAQAYRTSAGVIGNGIFWLVAALSAMTTWMLIGTWRHTRRRIQAQQALVAETNFRRAMENSILTGMRALDLKGRISYVNAAFCQMTGWNESELVGQEPPFPYWPDDDRDTLQERLEEELSGISSASGFQVRVKRKDGSLFDARMYVSPLVDALGQHTGWMTSMTDITEPNRIREQLSAAHDRFTTVLEGIDASVSVAPLGSQELLFANKLYRQWFDATTQGHLQLMAQAGSSYSASVRSDEDEMDNPLVGLPTGDVTEVRPNNAEVFVPELSKWLEVRSRYLHWVDGRLAQMVIATDITLRKLAEEQAQVQAAKAQASSRLITMGEMASSVAHELNQPLTAINNYCNGIISRMQSNNLSQEDLLFALQKTTHQAQRAGQIIQRIKSFVKRSGPNRSMADAPTMIAEAVELANIELKRRRVNLSQKIASPLPRLHVDPILIEQVLINLMKNAAESIDLAERPYPLREVRLEASQKQIDEQTVIEFIVEDNGKGLSPEVLEHLFEAFYSTKSEGMGIGLNLCRSIVESHQGRMRAQNLYNDEVLVGCRFSFWLPINSAGASIL
jgi:PAS domain S-box-containing protein